MTDISSTVFELRSEPTTLGGAIGILSNGLRLFHRLGVYDDLLSRGSSHSTLTLRSLKGSIITAQDIVGQVRQQNGGFGYLRIKRRDLLDVLLAAAEKAKIPIHYGKKITKIEETEEQVKVTFSDGTTDTGHLLLGCDGIHSAVRKLYVDPQHVTEYTGFSGLGAMIPTSVLPDGAADDLKGLNATLTTEGTFLTMSCSAKGDEALWAFSKEVPLPSTGDTRDGWEVKREEEVADFQQELWPVVENAKGDWGKTMRAMVKQTSVVNFYPIFKLAPGGKWYRGKCLLLGDAAHAMAPHAGQGVSMAAEDVFMIARLLEDPGRSLGDAYAAFDRTRRPRINEITKQATSNSEVRRKSGEWGLWVKETVIWAYFRASSLVGYNALANTERQLLYDVDEAEI
jgi:2-polyprenyl-6-methoxyphenol hydroxylase-like FAD-dependent oxidoreductase